jgi:hypothetical protein
MSPNPLKSPVLFSALCGWLVLFAASLLPVWKVNRVPIALVDEWVELISSRQLLIPPLPEKGTLWEAMKYLPFLLKYDEPFSVLDRHKENLMLAFSLLMMGAIAGRLIYWCRWERGPSITSSRLAAGKENR